MTGPLCTQEQTFVVIASRSEKCQKATSITDGGSVRGDRKLKERLLAPGRPQPPTMGFDNRAADREAHALKASIQGTVVHQFELAASIASSSRQTK
jgi:hypothetical protein